MHPLFNHPNKISVVYDGVTFEVYPSESVYGRNVDHQGEMVLMKDNVVLDTYDDLLELFYRIKSEV